MPPKGKSISGGEDAFLFVNEDFSTLFEGAKNTDLGRSKQSHVQRQSFAKRRRRSRKEVHGSSTTSPTPSEGTLSPLIGSDLIALRSNSEDRLPLLPFPESNSLWSPTVTDESTSTTALRIESPGSFDRSRVPPWCPPTVQPSYAELYPLIPQRETLCGTPPFDSAFIMPSVFARQAFGGQMKELEEPLSPSPVASTSGTDPFNNIQYALEKWAPTLMRHFTMNTVSEFFQTDLQATSLQTMRHVESLHEDMRSCMSDPAEMYALLAASSCHALRRQGRLDLPELAPEDSNRVTLLFKFKAFEALRLRLSRGELSRGMVIAIQRLICAALFTSSFSAVEAHYRAELSMIRALGGLDAFNDYQKERLIMHSFLYAISTRSPPRMELSWDPGEVPAETNLEVVLYMNQQNLFDPGCRICTIAEDSETLLHPVVAQCVPQLVETQQVFAWLRAGPYQPAEYRWLTQRRLAIIHRLLSVDVSVTASPAEVVRLALLYYCTMAKALPRTDDALIDLYVIPQLKLWGVNALLEAFDSWTDLLLWVTVIFGVGIVKRRARTLSDMQLFSSASPQSEASASASGGAQYLDVADCVARSGRMACKALGITTEAQLQRSLRMFLFDGDFVDVVYMSFALTELQLID